MKRTANRTGLMLLLALAGMPAFAQQASSNSQSASSGQSLGEYARQVRKSPDANSKARVFDNDNLPRTEKLSIVGTTPPAAGSITAEGTNESTAPAGSETKTPAEAKPASTNKTPSTAPEDDATKAAAAKQWTEKVDSQQQQIDLMTRELDVAQREYQIRAAAMYADAGNRLRNSADWDKQDAQYKQQIADKQKALDEAKQKLDDLKDEARKAGAPESVQQPAQSQ